MKHSTTQSNTIGAGINGLLAVTYLTRAGHKVTVLRVIPTIKKEFIP